MTVSSEVRCSCITRHLTISIMICLQRWKLTNTSVHRDKEGETKKGHRDGEGEHSENDEGNDEPAESRSSSFPTSPQRREQCTMCCVFHTKTKISAVYTLLMMPKIRVSISIPVVLGGLKRHKTKVCFSPCVYNCLTIKIYSNYQNFLIQSGHYVD